ncbi:MFS transporter [Pseudonocardia lutea]|uniref:MFS transporter n=1 Tax=Pseudonocardia lutea TaxID=2172015 RepID=A0ABW1I9N1_9PSEU
MVLGSAALCGSLVQTLVVPLLPSLPALLDVSPSSAAWLVTATLLSSAVTTPLLSRLGDTFGRRRMLVTALGLLTVGSALCALATSFVPLLLGRAAQGTAMAVVPLGISLAHSLPAVRRPSLAVSTISAMMGIGGAVALPLAGWTFQHFDYHVLFWATAVAAGSTVALVLLVVPRDTGAAEASRAVDVRGAFLLSGVLLGVLLPLTQGRDWGWTSPATLGTAAAALVLGPVFVLTQRRTPDPIVDVRVFATRTVLFTNLASLLTGFTLFDNFVSTVRVVQAPVETGYGLGMSPLAAGLILLPTGLVMAIVAPLGGRLIELRGPRVAMLLGLAVLFAGSLVRLVGGATATAIITGSALIGIGTALAFAAMPSLVLTASPPDQAAGAAGLNALSRSLGTTAASAVSGAVLAAMTFDVGGTPQPSAAGFTLVAALGSAAALLAVPLVLAARPAGGQRPR